MNDDLRVRDATLEDRGAIGRLWREMMEFHADHDPRFFHLKPDALDIWLEHLDECMSDEENAILVAEAGGELVGFAMGRPGEDPPPFASPRHGFVTNFAVTAAWRRRGVGRRLVAALAEAFRAQGITEMRLTVAAGNPASNAFWREMGFEPWMVSMRRT
jgi:ribosomal protein S18 acetylase RimI-like enzyme